MFCALVQANFFGPLAAKYPEQAMTRFESGQYPVNAASKMAYVKAASALGRLDQVDMKVMMIVEISPVAALALTLTIMSY